MRFSQWTTTMPIAWRGGQHPDVWNVHVLSLRSFGHSIFLAANQGSTMPGFPLPPLSGKQRCSGHKGPRWSPKSRPHPSRWPARSPAEINRSRTFQKSTILVACQTSRALSALGSWANSETSSVSLFLFLSHRGRRAIPRVKNMILAGSQLSMWIDINRLDRDSRRNTPASFLFSPAGLPQLHVMLAVATRHVQSMYPSRSLGG